MCEQLVDLRDCARSEGYLVASSRHALRHHQRRASRKATHDRHRYYGFLQGCMMIERKVKSGGARFVNICETSLESD
jgi:hypothetical protein